MAIESAAGERPFHIAVLNSHPIQYFAPLYAYLNAQADIKVTALYLSDHGLKAASDPGFGTSFAWDIDLLEGYEHRFIGKAAGRPVVGAGFWGLTDFAIWGAVKNGGYDALWTHGHAYGSNIIAMLAARSAGIPVFLRSDTSNILRRHGLRRLARERFHDFVLGLCDRFLAVGDANRRYYLDHGISPDRIHSVPYAVDNDRFIKQAILTPTERIELRASLGIHDERPVILYLSKLQRRKHPEYVVEGAAKLRQDGLEPHVLFVGSGEMEDELRQRVSELDLPDVHFAGFRNQSDLPRIYAASDIFVLPAEQEPFGLVVNEAMCAGLPIVVTDEVGAAYSLVEQGVNGSVVPAADLDAFAAALKPLVASAELRRNFGQASRELVGRHGFDKCLAGIRSAIAASKQHKQ